MTGRAGSQEHGSATNAAPGASGRSSRRRLAEPGPSPPSDRPRAAACSPGPAMGVRRWLLALLLLWLLLSAGSGAPLAEGADGKDLEEGNIRNLVHPRGARSGAGHRHTGWRKTRRPRPRLSHKGPMPF
ncbi:apelin [Pelodiscus sinensis]|uniref:apelin n=1 Tax=Pelodiscus sinensis TaxID=13735 RepID=UPI003F6C12A8